MLPCVHLFEPPELSVLMNHDRLTMMTDGTINTDPGHQTTIVLANMSETTPITSASPLVIARKPFGCVTFVDGPFKHFSEEFTLFLNKALFCAAQPSDVDAINAQAHSDDSVMNNEITAFVQPVAEFATCPKSPTFQVDHAAQADCVLDVANHIEVINEPTTEASITEVFTTNKISGSPVEEAAPSVATHVLAAACIEDETFFITQESSVEEYGLSETSTISGTESVEFTLINNDIPVAEHTPESQLDNAAIVNETQQIDSLQQAFSTTEDDATAAEKTAIVQNDLVEAISAAEDVTPENATTEDATAAEETAIMQKDLVNSAISTIEEATADEETAILQNDFDAISTFEGATVVEETVIMENDFVDAIKNLVIDDSETDVKTVIRDILDWHPELDFETDVEKDLEPASPLSAISENHTDTMPVTIPIPAIAFPLILEDDFDAAVSSILDTELEHLLDIDITWSVPHIVEKGKSERDIVRERLANKSTTQFNRQNLRLEKAAQELFIDGTAPMQIAMTTTDAVQDAREDSASVTYIEPERKEGEIFASEANVTEDLETFTDTEDVVVQLTKVIASGSGMHSRNSSTSSGGSRLSEPVFDSQDCPDTPVTEYCMSPNKSQSDQNTGDELLQDAGQTTE